MKQKKTALMLSLVLVCIVTLLLGGIAYTLLRGPVAKITTDLKDYRVVMGNHDNESPQTFIDSFFPNDIETHFIEPKYYYRGQTIDSYACEAYLDFSITDSDKFDDHYQSLNVFGNSRSAYFSDEYELWLVDDYLDMEQLSDGLYHIDDAQLGVVLCSQQQQRFIYSAIAVHDGYTATTDDLGYFFRQFNIDPPEFYENLKLRNRR